MFAPALGISEDPATGSASGPLGAYLLKYGLAQGGDMVSEQGFEMGRPSFIHIEVRRSGDPLHRSRHRRSLRLCRLRHAGHRLAERPPELC